MPGLLYDPRNVVKGMAMLFYRPWSETQTFPSDSTPLFTPTDPGWGTDWHAAGATNEGFKFVVDTSTTPTNIEEQSTPAAIDLESRDVRIEASLAEDTLTTMKLVYAGGSISVTAATTTNPGVDVLSFTDQVDRLACVLEMRNRKGLPRRIIIPEMMPGGSVDTEFRRASDPRLYPLRLAAVCPVSQIQVRDVTAPATGA